MEQISIFSPNIGKCRPEKTPYLDSFHAVCRLHVEFSNGLIHFPKACLQTCQTSKAEHFAKIVNGFLSEIFDRVLNTPLCLMLSTCT